MSYRNQEEDDRGSEVRPRTGIWAALTWAAKARYWRWMTRRIYARARSRQRRGYSYRIGAFDLEMPPGHDLEIHQLRCPLYDRSLGDVASVVAQKYPDSVFLDVGANVGDSAALIRTHASNRIICVEGCSQFIPWLERNVVQLGGEVGVVSSFLMPRADLSPSEVIVNAGTARVVANELPCSSHTTMTLSRVFADAGGRVGLLKTDLDGGDFEILLSAMDAIVSDKPVVFMEYMLEQEGAADNGLGLVRSLALAGYRYALVYDNSGRFMLGINDSIEQRFEDLNLYLESSLRFSPHGLLYYDVCFVHERDHDLFEQMRTLELRRQS